MLNPQVMMTDSFGLECRQAVRCGAALTPQEAYFPRDRGQRNDARVRRQLEEARHALLCACWKGVQSCAPVPQLGGGSGLEGGVGGSLVSSPQGAVSRLTGV